ncbi:hypothetical protein [Ferrimonas pelagia]|uniref:Lipoprotein n=1 Tax=Ferrimonas pelagia TaxID=1177826 RepID=A0ABP9FR32_9GAMM
MSYRKLLLPVGLCSILIACGGDNNNGDPTPEPPLPLPDSIDIDATTTLELALDQFDGPSGAVYFTLTGDDALPVIGVQRVRVLYLGFPPAGPTSSKYGLPWHQTENYDCRQIGEHCALSVEEITLGQYQLLPSQLYWQANIEEFKMMLEIDGELASGQLLGQ